jgi:hypothetical protein
MPIKQTKKMKNIIFLLFIIPLIGISQKKTQVIETDSIIIIDEYVTIDKAQIERYIQEDSIVTILNIAYVDSVSIVVDSVQIDSVNYRLDTSYITTQIEQGFDTTYQTLQITVRQDITLDSLFREALYADITKRDARIDKGKRGLNRIQENTIIPEREIIKELNRLIRKSSNRGYKKTLTEVIEKEDGVSIAVTIRGLFTDEESLSRSSPAQLKIWAKELGITLTDRDEIAAAIWILEE